VHGERDEDHLSPVERHVERSYVDAEASGYGKPLSRRVRQTQRSVESYLRAGSLPRYMERARDIERGIRTERIRLEHAYRALQEECGQDAREFARRWRGRVRAWDFEQLNQLIREHNEWYPVERNLPLDPRTRDYVKIRGRSYRRTEIGAEWVFEHFPPVPRPVA